ncbi:MAG: hypothetical protein IJY38_00265 [Clostridia bacterium]|nr:hypothetical protein [Clostridia bacterium]
MKKFLKFLTMTLATVAAATMFFACTPSSLEKATAKMEKAGYSVSDYTANDDAEGCQGGILATKKKGEGLLDGSYKIIALFFDTKENAEAFHNDAKAITSNIKLDGKWVYWGDEQAEKDFN